ncbi:MAG: GGDEF domain-containing protein [Burkholderiales bacterium]|nr:GGDEF domain-containing protein [Burkholderiales bacterium]
MLASAFAFAAVVGTLAFRLAHGEVVTKSRATLEGLAVAVERTAAIGAFAQDRVLLKEVVDGLARHPLVGSIAVLGPDGQPLVHRQEDSPQRSGTMVVERRLSSPFNAAEGVGTLRVIANDAVLMAGARDEAVARASLMVLQTGALAALLYFAATQMVSKPIVQLARSLERIRPGTAERLPTPRLHQRDEIGKLIRGANSLLEETESAIRRERELRAAVEAMEAQYRQIFDATSAGIFVLDADGGLINGNPTVLKIIGSALTEVRQLRGQDFVHRVFDRPERVMQMIDESRKHGETVSGDLELLSPDGASRWVHCLISVQARRGGDAAREEFIEGVIYDVTERRVGELAMRQRAEHDPLTGLKNRAACDASIDRLLAEASAEGGKMALLYIDLDGFKQVNDTLGHDAGDQVLRQCARRLQAAMRRATDPVARLGGDEFVIVMPGAGSDDAATAIVAAEVVRLLAEPYTLDDGRVARIGSSIGIASYPLHGHTRRALATAADQALYDVKRHGKNAFAVAGRGAAST